MIDVQGYVLNTDGHLARTVQQHNPELQQGFLDRAESMIANIQRLQAAFREQDRRVFFTRHGAQLPDGSDLVVRRRGREEAALAATFSRSRAHLRVLFSCQRLRGKCAAIRYSQSSRPLIGS